MYVKFFLDNKIHTRTQLISILDDIPIIGEIPYLADKDLLNKIDPSDNSRDILAESIRMTIANLNFVFLNKSDNTEKGKTILVTSSVKGEGKTIISSNLASL